MAPRMLQPGAIEAKSSRTTGASNNAPPSETQQQGRHQLVHRDAAIVATENMTQDAHLRLVGKTGRCRNTKQHAIGCESVHIDVDDGQLTVYRTADVRRDLRDQFIAARKGIPPWSTQAFLRTVREIEHHDVVSSSIVTDQSSDKRPREWTNQALTTLVEATESYMMEVTANSHSRSTN